MRKKKEVVQKSDNIERVCQKLLKLSTELKALDNKLHDIIDFATNGAKKRRKKKSK